MTRSTSLDRARAAEAEARRAFSEGTVQQARRALRVLLAMTRPSHSAKFRAEVHLLAVRILDRAGDHRGALAHAQAMAKLTTRMGDNAPRGNAWVSVARQHLLSGQAALAERALGRAIPWIESADDVAAGEALTNAGSVYLELGALDDARRCLERAIAIAANHGAARLNAFALGLLASVRLERDENAAAEQLLDSAMPMFESIGDRPMIAVALGYRGILEDRRAAHSNAVQTLARAVRNLEELGMLEAQRHFRSHLAIALASDGAPRAAVEVLELAGSGLLVDLARALIATRQGDFDSNEGRAIVGDGIAALDSKVRLIARWLAESLRAPSSSAEIRIALDGSFFEIEGERVELGHRLPLRRILAALWQAHRTDPRRVVGVRELQRAAWPGERLIGDSGASRVYATIRLLRRLGLRDLIVSVGHRGYRLDRDQVIAEASLKTS